MHRVPKSEVRVVATHLARNGLANSCARSDGDSASPRRVVLLPVPASEASEREMAGMAMMNPLMMYPHWLNVTGVAYTVILARSVVDCCGGGFEMAAGYSVGATQSSGPDERDRRR